MTLNDELAVFATGVSAAIPRSETLDLGYNAFRTVVVLAALTSDINKNTSSAVDVAVSYLPASGRSQSGCSCSHSSVPIQYIGRIIPISPNQCMVTCKYGNQVPSSFSLMTEFFQRNPINQVRGWYFRVHIETGHLRFLLSATRTCIRWVGAYVTYLMSTRVLECSRFMLFCGRPASLLHLHLHPRLRLLLSFICICFFFFIFSSDSFSSDPSAALPSPHDGNHVHEKNTPNHGNNPIVNAVQAKLAISTSV